MTIRSLPPQVAPDREVKTTVATDDAVWDVVTETGLDGTHVTVTEGGMLRVGGRDGVPRETAGVLAMHLLAHGLYDLDDLPPELRRVWNALNGTAG